MADFYQWLENNKIGDLFNMNKLPKMVKFSDVTHDRGTGEWKVDLNKALTSLIIDELKVGDEISDYSANRTPYWEVDGIDEDKKIVYLKPIGKNPHTNQIGAGGKKLDDFDYDVLDGTFEKEKIDSLLNLWKSGNVHDVKDIKYLLLGTVPFNFGPNGAQGGWYNASDTGSNRGGQKGMSSKEIVKKDANTLKNTFGFKVPIAALNGTMNAYQFTDFVNGNSYPVKGEEVEGENWKDINSMANFILNDNQPSLVERNVTKLIDFYTRGHLPRIYGRIQDDKKSQQAIEKWRSGKFERKELEQFMKDLAKKFILRKHKKETSKYDPFYLAKEKFAKLVIDKNWKELFPIYEKNGDISVRNIFAYHYSENGNFQDLERMMNNETDVEPMSHLLGYAFKKDKLKTKEWVLKNEKKLDKIIEEDDVGYYSKNLVNLINRAKNAKTNDKEWFD